MHRAHRGGRGFTGVTVELDAGNRIFTTLPVVPVEREKDYPPPAIMTSL